MWHKKKTIDLLQNLSSKNQIIRTCSTKVFATSRRYYCENKDTPIIPIEEAKRFIYDCMTAVETPDDFARQQAEMLVAADYRGHYSHGMNRLEMYVTLIEKGHCDNKASPCIMKEFGGTAWVDGRNCLGVVVGNFCNKLAMFKARQHGISCVSVKGSSHYGICGKYAEDALKEGLIQFNCTNTSPLAVPTGSKDTFFGTNPLALGAPANGDSFVLDMATTTVAVGKIELAARKGEKLPESWALTTDGKPETDAKKALANPRVSPLGGYKGSGLMFMVELLSGILSGSKYGPNIEKWGKLTGPPDIGHCFIIIDPKCFAPGFENRLSDVINKLRSSSRVDPDVSPMAAGDKEKKHMKAVDEAGGVRYVKNQMETCDKLSKRLCVKPLNSS